MLVTSRELLNDALRNNYAVGAFNVENMEMVIAVLKAAEETQSPVIMQTTPGTLKYAGADFYFANIKPKPIPEPPSKEKKTAWRCKICGFTYVGETLPPDYVCPLCKHPASDFEKIEI